MGQSSPDNLRRSGRSICCQQSWDRYPSGTYFSKIAGWFQLPPIFDFRFTMHSGEAVFDKSTEAALNIEEVMKHGR